MIIAMFLSHRRNLGRFFMCIISGALLGALLGWFLLGGVDSGFPLVPLLVCAAWGGSWGLITALQLTLIRPGMVRHPGPRTAFLWETVILCPGIFLSALAVSTYILPHADWMDQPQACPEIWIAGLIFLAGASCLDSLSYMGRGIHFYSPAVTQKRVRQGEGFMLAMSLCPPEELKGALDNETQLRLTQLAQKVFHRQGAGLLGMPIRTGASDLALFIPGRSNSAKNAVFHLLSRCQKKMLKNAAKYRSQFGFSPRLSAALHFGVLNYASPSVASREALGNSADFTMVLLSEKEARNRKTSLWVSDSALNKIILPRQFHVAGSTPLKPKAEVHATRMYFVNSIMSFDPALGPVYTPHSST